MRRISAVALGALVAFGAFRAAAQDQDAGLIPESVPAPAQDGDADLIPSSVREEPTSKPAPPVAPKPPSKFHTTLFLEDAFTLPSASQAVAVPYPAPLYRWQNRTSFDAIVRWTPSPRLTFASSIRLNVIEQDGQAFFSDRSVRNDLRETYVTWEPFDNTYVEAGRINIRNGVALGFNPTDFFKTRSLVGQASLDPSVLRQNRVGTLMVRGQTIWNGGSASLALAPKLTDATPVGETNRHGLDPRFDATNAAYRMFGTLALEIADLNPQLLAYYEQHRAKVGLDLSQPIGDALVAYAEWAGGPEMNLAARANAYGKETGTLPPILPVLPPTSTSTRFRNDVAAGLSWTIATKITVNIEYHFHQAGFSKQDWRSWFELGSDPSSPFPTSALWYVRGYATDQQEPTTMHQAFVRAAWPKAFVNELELTGFAFVDILDGSVLTQISARYYASSAWTLAAYGSANIGAVRTERGSFPQRFSAIFAIVYYL